MVNDQRYYVHADLIAAISKPLNRLMNVDMQEKSNGYAELPGVSQETFEKFLEWLYTGRYQLPQPEVEVEVDTHYPHQEQSAHS